MGQVCLPVRTSTASCKRFGYIFSCRTLWLESFIEPYSSMVGLVANLQQSGYDVRTFEEEWQRDVSCILVVERGSNSKGDVVLACVLVDFVKMCVLKIYRIPEGVGAIHPNDLLLLETDIDQIMISLDVARRACEPPPNESSQDQQPCGNA